MKTRQIENCVKKHFNVLLDKYKVKGDLIYVMQDNLLKGYCLESSGYSSNELAVWIFIQPLFVPKENLSFTFGYRLKHNKTLEWWDVSNENEEMAFKSILSSIQNDGEKFLEKVNSTIDFFNMYKSEAKDNIRIYEAVAYSSLMQDDDELRVKMLKGLIDFTNKSDLKDIDWVISIRNDATSLLTTKNNEERLGVLEKWKRETLSNLKLV